MHTQERKRLEPLQNGQLWKIEHGYLYIVELGSRLIQYKMLREVNQRAAVTRLMRLEALVNFLRHSEAELVSDSHALAMMA
jgi:hypothetical protein